jgi:hypothetical protein
VIRTFLITLAFIAIAYVVYDFGQYGQLYDTIPARGYATVYYEFATPHEQILMLWAAEWRCEGDLQMNFECKE